MALNVYIRNEAKWKPMNKESNKKNFKDQQNKNSFFKRKGKTLIKLMKQAKFWHMD